MTRFDPERTPPAGPGALWNRRGSNRRRFSGNSRGGKNRQKLPAGRQQRLKRPPGTAGAKVVAAQFFHEFFMAAHDPLAFLDAAFGGETFTAFAGDLERTWRMGCEKTWRTSCECPPTVGGRYPILVARKMGDRDRDGRNSRRGRKSAFSTKNQLDREAGYWFCYAE